MALESAPIKGTVYLNLSLFCQAVLNELWDIERGPSAAVRKPTALERAINSLRNSPKVQEQEKVFQSYEEMRVLAEVLKRHGIRSQDGLADLLAAITTSKARQPKISKTQKAITLFAELSKQASARVRFPEEGMPERVRHFVSGGNP